MCDDPAMQVEISPETQDILDQLVQRARFASASDALSFAVQHLWDEQAWDDPVWLENVGRLVDEARTSLAEGRGTVIRDSEDARILAAEVIARAREKRNRRLAAE